METSRTFSSSLAIALQYLRMRSAPGPDSYPTAALYIRPTQVRLSPCPTSAASITSVRLAA